MPKTSRSAFASIRIDRRTLSLQ